MPIKKMAHRDMTVWGLERGRKTGIAFHCSALRRFVLSSVYLDNRKFAAAS
jgi:hypothetical protein